MKKEQYCVFPHKIINPDNCDNSRFTWRSLSHQIFFEGSILRYVCIKCGTKKAAAFAMFFGLDGGEVNERGITTKTYREIGQIIDPAISVSTIAGWIYSTKSWARDLISEHEEIQKCLLDWDGRPYSFKQSYRLAPPRPLEEDLQFPEPPRIPSEEELKKERADKEASLIKMYDVRIRKKGQKIKRIEREIASIKKKRDEHVKIYRSTYV